MKKMITILFAMCLMLSVNSQTSAGTKSKGGLLGSGTVGYIPTFSAAKTLINSTIHNSGYQTTFNQCPNGTGGFDSRILMNSDGPAGESRIILSNGNHNNQIYSSCGANDVAFTMKSFSANTFIMSNNDGTSLLLSTSTYNNYLQFKNDMHFYQLGRGDVMLIRSTGIINMPILSTYSPSLQSGDVYKYADVGSPSGFSIGIMP